MQPIFATASEWTFPENTFNPLTASSREQNLDTLRGIMIIGVLFGVFPECDNRSVYKKFMNKIKPPF